MREKFKKLKNRLGKWFWLILIVAIVVVLKLTVFKSKPMSVTTAKVVKGSLTETISVTGTVKADNFANLTFQGGGRLSYVNIKEGQVVKKGQAIAGLDTVILNSTYQQALNNYRNYQAQASSVLDSVQGHSGDETFAQKASRTAAEVARDNAYDVMIAAVQNLRYANLYAPFNGVMAKVEPKYPGTNITPATASYIIIDPDTVYFSGELAETDLRKVKLGQKVIINLDAYEDENFEGTVQNIGVLAFTSGTGGNAYDIRFDLPTQASLPMQAEDLKFRVGMQGDAEIILSATDNVLKVPFNSVVNEDGQDYVWIIESGKAKKVAIETRGSSSDDTEIKSGLSEGMEIIVDPSNKLVENQRLVASN